MLSCTGGKDPEHGPGMYVDSCTCAKMTKFSVCSCTRGGTLENKHIADNLSGMVLTAPLAETDGKIAVVLKLIVHGETVLPDAVPDGAKSPDSAAKLMVGSDSGHANRRVFRSEMADGEASSSRFVRTEPDPFADPKHGESSVCDPAK